jgi:serine/threonine-protein kinase
LKPENIFLTKDEDSHLLAKIVDFGLAKFYEPTNGDVQSVRLTREGALFGTPAYMSPEQAKGKGEVDHRADIWALGCIVYECLTGQTVWNVEQGVAMILAQIAGAPLPKPAKLRPDLPPGFDAWFQKALERDPDRRFQTARELADALNKAVTMPAGRALTLSSDDESALVDELLGDQAAAAATRVMAPPSPRAPQQLQGAAGGGLQTRGVAPQSVRPGPAIPPVPWATNPPVSSRPPPAPAPAPIPRSAVPVQEARPNGGHRISGKPVAPESPKGTARAVWLLMVVALLCLGGYAIWLYVLHPPGKEEITSRGTRSKTAPSDSVEKRPKEINLPDVEGYAEKIQKAQALLANGQAPQALAMFKEAFQAGQAPAARSLLSHISIPIEEAGGPCKITGISRPRPFAIEVAPAFRPVALNTAKGLVVGWIDNHVDGRRRQGYTVLLDNTMHRVSPPFAITPEASSARQLQMLPAGDKIAILWWDDAGKEPGVYARLLEADGHIATPAQRISQVKKSELSPVFTPAEDGGIWAVWQEDFERGLTDIVARKLSATLEPEGAAVRLTAITATASGTSTPDAFVAHGNLWIAFAANRGRDRFQIMLQKVPLTSPELKTGLVTPKRAPAKPGDRFVGELTLISPRYGKNTTPDLTCTDDGCFTVWDDEKAGALAAFVPKDGKAALWYREFAPKGFRPSVASAHGGAVISWYEESRLRFSSIARDGLGPPSILSRVSGLQPQPDIVPGDKPGRWYISFRDFESAHLEVFALRADCQ